jgi:hypothetical protein
MIASNRTCRRVRAVDFIAVGAVILGSLAAAKADQNVESSRLSTLDRNRDGVI